MQRTIQGTVHNDTIVGGAGPDLVNAKAGDDQVSTGNSADVVYGKSGEDTIILGAGADQVYAGSQNDYVDGQNGSDTIFGGNGDDALFGGDVQPSNGASSGPGGIDDHIDGGAGTDQIYGRSGNDRLFGQNQNDEIFGEAGSDHAFGGKGDDQISGGAGNDVLYGGNDDDFVQGDRGADTLNGAHGSDTLSGGTGNDVLYGGSGNDTVEGKEGRDLLLGASGEDILTGDQGDDALYGGEENDALYGGAGLDDLVGGSGADLMHGGSGGDFLQGDFGNDVLHGEAGDDVINAGSGQDSAYGGAADDEINLFDGNDYAVGGAGEDAIYGGNGNDRIYGDKLPENLLSGSETEIGQSIAQFEGTDWFVTYNAKSGQTEMSQSISTEAQTTYTVSIDVAANFSAGFTSGAVEVVWNGQVIDKIEVESGVFNTLSYAVQGTGAGTGLTIRTAEPDTPATSIFDTSGSIFTYDKLIDLGDGPIAVNAFAPGQAKLFQVIDGQLQVFDAITESYVGTGAAADAKVNAIGLNIEDDLIYGYARTAGLDALGNPISANSLIVMDATGSIYKLGDGDQSDFVGDFDGQGNLWTFHTTLDRVTKIDVSELDEHGNPAVESYSFPSDLSRSNMYDVAYNPLDNQFYGVVAPGAVAGQGKVLMIDMIDVEAGGQPVVADIPITHTEIDGILKEGMPKGAFGAVFIDGVGNLYAGLNNGDHDLSADTADSGGIYRIVFDENGRYAKAVLMSSAQSTSNNDGAMDTRGNDPFAEIDAAANVLVKEISVVQAEGPGWDDVIFGGDGRDTVHGGGRHDEINGGLGDDLLFGEAGHDTIFGLGGDDNLFGGSGDDSIHGGVGSDTVDGGTGDDLVSGEAGDDSLSGGAGNDVLTGGVGADLLFGDNGADTLFGSEGSDQIFGGNGNDVLEGGSEGDTLSGDTGRDRLDGDLGDDLLNGGGGNDLIFGGQGDDTLNGGAGSDSLFGGSGADLVSGGAGNDLLYGGAQDDVLKGGAGMDQLLGDAGEDLIFGGSGADTIFGGDGDDTLEAGTGRNVIAGGGGADTFVFLAGNGIHHDAIVDYQIYGENADAIDLSDYRVLDAFGSRDAWQSERISLDENASLIVQLGYGQTVSISSEHGFSSIELDVFYDTILL